MLLVALRWRYVENIKLLVRTYDSGVHQKFTWNTRNMQIL